MKKIYNENPLRNTLIGLCFLAIAFYGVIALADYRPGASTLLDSTFTGDDPNVGVHIPVISTVPGSTGTVSNSLFTSGTSAIAIDTAATITTAFDVFEIRVHLSAASSTQTVIVSIDSGAGTEFDTVLDSQAMSAADKVFRFNPPASFRAVDALKVVYGNASSDTAGVEIKYVTP